MRISLLSVWPAPLVCHCVYSLSHGLAAGVYTPCATSVRACRTVQTLASVEMGSTEAWESFCRTLQSDWWPSREATTYLYSSSQKHSPGRQISRLNCFTGNQEIQAKANKLARLFGNPWLISLEPKKQQGFKHSEDKSFKIFSIILKRPRGTCMAVVSPWQPQGWASQLQSTSQRRQRTGIAVWVSMLHGKSAALISRAWIMEAGMMSTIIREQMSFEMEEYWLAQQETC